MTPKTKKENIIRLIDDLFSDTTVSAAETLDHLIAIQESLEPMIESLERDVEEASKIEEDGP